MDKDRWIQALLVAGIIVVILMVGVVNWLS